jgi:hypothetical protein
VGVVETIVGVETSVTTGGLVLVSGYLDGMEIVPDAEGELEP